MTLVPPIEYGDASPEVRAVYDDIIATRRVPTVNNFWKVLAHDPANLARTWAEVKDVMADGALDPLVKEIDLRRGDASPTTASTASTRTPRPRAPRA